MRRRSLLRPGVMMVVIVGASVGGYVVLKPDKTATTAAATGAVERTATATKGTMSENVSASGTLEPADTEDLSFSVSGKVTAVNVKANQAVKKGDVLATIESAALQSQVASAQATVDADKSRLSSDTSAGAATAQINADKANLAAAEANLAQAKADLADANLMSPIDGVVSTVNLSVGQQLGSSGGSGSNLSGSGTNSGRNANNGSSGGSGSTTAQVQVVSTAFVVNLSVDDTEIGKLAAGQSATITTSTAAAGNGGSNGRGRFNGGFFPGAIGGDGATGNAANRNGNPTNGNGSSANQAPATSSPGTVSSVGTIASSSSGVATFPVVVDVAGTPAGFFTGASVEVSIAYREIEDAIQVPALAVTQENGTSYVTVEAEDGTRTKTAVTTGITSGAAIQITSGLKGGEVVVISIPVAANNGNGNSNRNGNGGTNGPETQIFTGPPPGGGRVDNGPVVESKP